MAVYQYGIDVSRYQGNINWGRVAAASKQFAMVRVGSSNSGGLYVDPYFLQNVNGAKAAGLRVGVYYYTYARTRAAVANELTTFLNVMQGLQLEYPVFVDVEDASLTSLGRATLTSLVQYAMDILYQRKWYAGWYSYTNYINSYLNAAALSQYPLWVADYRSTLGYNGSYAMWQYSGSGSVNGISGACDLNRSYQEFLPEIIMGSPALLWRRWRGSGLWCSTPGVSIFTLPTSTMWSAICRWATTALSSRAPGNITAMIGSSSATVAASIGPLSSATATGSNRVIVTAIHKHNLTTTVCCITLGLQGWMPAFAPYNLPAESKSI